MSCFLLDSPFLLHQALSPPTTRSQKAAGPAVLLPHAQQRHGKRFLWQQVSAWVWGGFISWWGQGWGWPPESMPHAETMPLVLGIAAGQEAGGDVWGTTCLAPLPILHSLREQQAGAIPSAPSTAQGKQPGTRVLRHRDGSSLSKKLLAQCQRKGRAGQEHL